MSDPRVSVVIAARNAEAFIGSAIASVLGQTRAAAEIIVVDDGSTDGTAAAAARFGPRVTLVQHQAAGVSRSRNAAVARAEGDWVAFLDADDEWLPGKLEQQARLMLDGVGFVHCDRLNVGEVDGLPERQSAIQPLVQGDIFATLLVTGNTITTSAVAIRRSLFLQLGGFDERLTHAEDWDLWLRAAAVSEVRAAPDALVRYRHQAASASRNPDAMIRARVIVAERALASDRGRRLSGLARRQAMSATWTTNGWEAARAGQRWRALGAYLRAAAWWPLSRGAAAGVARQILGR